MTHSHARQLHARQLFVMTAVISILASGVALWFQRGDFDPLDRLALPGIGALWILSSVALRFRWLRLGQAQLLMFVAYAAYFLLALNHQFRVFAPQHHLLSQNTYWFAPLYAVAFLYFLPQQALRFSLAIFGLSLLITVAHFVLNPALGGDLTLVASTLQFVMVGFTMILLQAVMGQRHTAMMAKQMAAYQDALTGTANRRAAEEHLLALEHSSASFTLVLFDLDHFKGINDQHGHAAGDSVLRAVVHEAQKIMPGGTMCARWGGEEFLLILPALPLPAVARSLQDFRECLESIRVGGVTGVTASFGVAERFPSETTEALLLRADRALYQAKALGRNRIQYSTPGSSDAESQ